VPDDDDPEDDAMMLDRATEAEILDELVTAPVIPRKGPGRPRRDDFTRQVNAGLRQAPKPTGEAGLSWWATAKDRGELQTEAEKRRPEMSASRVGRTIVPPILGEGRQSRRGML
jgi:hypothetical protein